MRGAHDEVVEELKRVRWRPLRTLLTDARMESAPSLEADANAVEPYRWFLSRVGDGVQLTQAGYLPPVVVEETMRALGWDARWIGKMNREDKTYPVLQLRDIARRTGLVRVHRGMLRRTVTGRRLTENPVGLWWHLADRLPVARGEIEQMAGVLFLLAVAAGQRRPLAIVADGLAALGVRLAGTHQPPTASDALDLARDTWTVFRHLGLLTGGSQDGAPPPPGAVALARAALLGAETSADPDAPATSPRSARPPSAVELTVTLRDIEPPIWRRLVVPTSLSLRELHGVLQTAMGWQNAHLHLFDVGGVLYGDVEDFPGELGDEDETTVDDVVAATRDFTYQYDFGDGWDHDVHVGKPLESVIDTVPRCLDGARACPPEDCGGPGGYTRLIEVLATPKHPERAELVEWLGGAFDAEAWDLATVNPALRSST